MNKTLSIMMLAAMTSLQASAQAPSVTTDTRYARGATMAFGRAKFSANGSAIVERGFCWSTDKSEPTIEDNTTKSTLSNNGLIFWMKDLEPATKHYARAYAKAADGSIGYGEVIKFYTIPKGNISWGYDNGGSDAENTRINNAVAECVDYWNNLANIRGLYLNVHYGASTPTADCSYGGWMRVGPNSSYQRTGTIMHEALHAIGVGTTGIWNSSTTPLRSGSGTGYWLGDRTTDLVRFLDNSTTAQLNGDGTHMWPYGINGAHEDTGSQMLYIGCSLIAQALGEDGLPLTSSRPFGTPCYSFAQEDETKYYIKSESEEHGLYTSFLVEEANKTLRWRKMTAAEAEANGAAAWYVTFTPDNQYYQLRNASTGNYVTYVQTGTNGIKTVTTSSPSVNENFQLMRSRLDIKTEAGTLVTKKRGYWIIHPDNSTATPACLSASTSGATATQNFNIDNDTQTQRWLILTADEAKVLDNASLIAAKDDFTKTLAMVEKIAATPHKEVTAGADDELAAAIATQTEACQTATSTAGVQSAVTKLTTALKTFLGKVMVADMEQPFDLTCFINNPSFDNGTAGWTIGSGGKYNYGEVEFYENAVSIQQSIDAMPKGTYTMKVQGFQRPGTQATVFDAYKNGQNDVKVRMWINTTTSGVSYIKNIMEERSNVLIHSGDKVMTDGTYVPNTMSSAAAYFEKGYYDNAQTSYISAKGTLKLMISGVNGSASSAHWAIFDNFRLYYYGPMTMDQITGVEAIEEKQEISDTTIYDITGRKIGRPFSELPKGIYIVNGKKITK